MKDLGDLHKFLGIEIIHTSQGIWLSQRQYVLNMLEKYGMFVGCKLISVPLDQNGKVSAVVGSLLEDPNMYMEMVGNLCKETGKGMLKT